jgi:hypothetical protein
MASREQSRFEEIEKATGAATDVEKPEAAMIAAGENLVQLRQRLPSLGVCIPLKSTSTRVSAIRHDQPVLGKCQPRHSRGPAEGERPYPRQSSLIRHVRVGVQAILSLCRRSKRADGETMPNIPGDARQLARAIGNA